MIVGVAGSYVAAFDLEHWGLWADGLDENDSLVALERAHENFVRFVEAHGAACAPIGEVVVVERRRPVDEGAFDFERESATSAERERTLTLYRWARHDLVQILAQASDAELDWVDPSRELPPWAWWRSSRQMAWHCAISESCYYLDRVGIPRPDAFAELTSPLPAPPTGQLLDLLAISRAHVEAWIEGMPSDLAIVHGSEVWTTRKVLRRLAGHERAENDVTRELLAKARRALS